MLLHGAELFLSNLGHLHLQLEQFLFVPIEKENFKQSCLQVKISIDIIITLLYKYEIN